ncbi:hypothetical protein [Francisella hispaniensis]|uniref:Uncharacterized protein n=1 Tax=Francisella hispaniensis FSC454 TaxID=1088883 RepID=A0AAC9J7V3_9GAMM|nr:hypothetical protein [Francisella hispaniensis]APD50796.1 hypothetical protein FSC454_06590 [Francisella hispaniensis FSC454]KYW82851.1 hypothetical protein AUF42_06745 [Francisella hispaniensis FSC454]
MSNLNFKETISLAATMYKRAFKITFVLAFMLSFVSEFCFVYLMNHGMADYIQSGNEADISQLPSGNIIAIMFLVIVVATIFVYAMIVILQGIMVKHELNVSDALKIALQIFSKRVFVFLGAFLLSMIAMTLFTMFLQYLGIFLGILLFLTVMPAVLLAQKGVFESISNNFSIIRNNFFYMFRISIVVLALMIIKPLVTFGLIYLLKNFGLEMSSFEMSIQNIIVTVVDAFILPFIFAISVATFFATSSK